jgi:hypothetical protein
MPECAGDRGNDLMTEDRKRAAPVINAYESYSIVGFIRLHCD